MIHYKFVLLVLTYFLLFYLYTVVVCFAEQTG